MATSGRRSGARRAPRSRSRSRVPALLGLALGVTLAIVAWGYLVLAAIDFGGDARAGDSGAWGYLALASVGAVACLFIGLILVARLLGLLGIGGASRKPADEPPPAPRPVGGRRAAR